MELKYIKTSSQIDKKILENIKQDLKNKQTVYVSHGWIDSHMHICEDPENKIKYFLSEQNLKQIKGLVGIIDAGSVGVNNIWKFKELIEKRGFIQKIFFLLNISAMGINKKNELETLNHFDMNLIESLSKENFILGVKARLSNQAVGEGEFYKNILNQLKTKTNILKMFHIGNPKPEYKTIMAWLNKGDIITHAYHGKNKHLFPYVKQIKNNGIHIDTGNGAESFSIKRFQAFLSMGLKPHTISTDLHDYSWNFNKTLRLEIIMGFMMECGLSLKEVVDMVTNNPKNSYIKHKWAKYYQTFTLFEIKNEKLILKDSYNEKKVVKTKIIPLGIIKENKWIKQF